MPTKKKAKTAKATPLIPTKVVVRKIGTDNLFKGAFKTQFTGNMSQQNDPIEWVEKNLGVTLFSNQIENIEHLFDPENSGFNILAARGAGKTWGLSAGLLAYSVLYAGLRVIVVGPKEKQAARILKEIYTILKSKGCKVSDQVDGGASSAHRIQFKNGSYIVALSGQEVANVEGEHGHILVIDEAHKVPTYSVTNKLAPMVGSLELTKIIRIGVAMGRNHFHKACTAPKAIVDTCPWNKAEIFLTNESKKQKPLFYKGVQFSRVLVGRMPVPLKKKYFPDRPDLCQATGDEISVLDWEMQYELIWADDVNNFLSDDDQKALFSGKHDLMTKGAIGELYAAGLDTAQGSITGRKNTDETVLAIWRMRGGKKERVASYIWKGDPRTQMEEIWQIIHPQDGLFRCKMSLVDYSNIGITTVDLFKARKVPILGRHFQATEPRSKKNWKNALYDHFLVQLQTGKVTYPDVAELEKQNLDAKGSALVQIKNALRGYWEWCSLERIRGKGLNDKIQAPADNVEGEEGESEGRAFDDVCTADVLAIWALDHVAELEQEMAHGGDLSGYEIPMGLFGPTSLSSMVPMAGGGQAATAPGKNPMAVAEMTAHANGKSGVAPTTREGELRQWLSSVLPANKR